MNGSRNCQSEPRQVRPGVHLSFLQRSCHFPFRLLDLGNSWLGTPRLPSALVAESVFFKSSIKLCGKGPVSYLLGKYLAR